MKTILALLLSLNIIQPYTVMNDNLTGNSEFSNFIQVSYEYTTEDPSIAIQLGFNAGAVSGNIENEFPAIYCMNLTFNFKSPVEYAEMTVNLYDPGNTAGYPSLNAIGENCFITANSRSQMTVKAYNTNVCYIKIIWSYEDVHDYFGYTAYSFDYTELQSNSNDWIKNGKTYVYVYNCRLTSCTLLSDPDYTSQLTSLINNTDGLESLLTAIRTNTSYLPTISTNIDSLNTLLNTINNKLDTLDNIQWLNMPSPTGVYRGYTTDFETYDSTDGSKTSGYFVYESFRANNENNYGIYKIRIPIGNAVIKYSDLKFYQIYNGSLIELTFNYYLYQQNRNDIVLYFIVNDSYHPWPNGNNPFAVYVNHTVYKYSEAVTEFKYILPSNIDYWTIYNTINQFTQLSKINNSLEQIISILGTTDLSQQDTQNKQDVDNWYNNLLQNITLPAIPQQPNKLPFIQHLFQVYGEIINIPGLDIFKWFLGIQAIVMLFGVFVR